MTAWQPIETAPKDGTYFLAYCPRAGIVLMVNHNSVRSETWSLKGNARNPEPTDWFPIECLPPVQVQS